MRVKDWMVTDLITVTPDTPLLQATKEMKQHNIRRLPVVDSNGDLIGIVTDRDLKEAGPSKVTTLDVHEQFYLFGELAVSDIMTRDPVTITPHDTVEKAAVIMLSLKISGLPVVDRSKPVGIITQDDISRVLTEITGVYRGGVQLALYLPDTGDSLSQVLELIAAHGCQAVSVLCLNDVQQEKVRKAYIRLPEENLSRLQPVLDELEKRGQLRYLAQDSLEPQYAVQMNVAQAQGSDNSSKIPH